MYRSGAHPSGIPSTFTRKTMIHMVTPHGRIGAVRGSIIPPIHAVRIDVGVTRITGIATGVCAWRCRFPVERCRYPQETPSVTNVHLYCRLFGPLHAGSVWVKRLKVIRLMESTVRHGTIVGAAQALLWAMRASPLQKHTVISD